MADVAGIWMEITSDLPNDVAKSWWAKIEKEYSHPKRHFYNLSYLSEIFKHFSSCKEHLKNSKAVSYAVFFHFLEYDSKSDSETKNIENFHQFATEAGIPEGSELHEEVCNLIKAASDHSTDEHKMVGTYGTEDKHYFLDLDMAFLGSDEDAYDDFAKQIRGDYDHLTDAAYKTLRSKVLQTFLLIPNIYATKQFRDRYERNARKNISSELEGYRS